MKFLALPYYSQRAVFVSPPSALCFKQAFSIVISTYTDSFECQKHNNAKHITTVTAWQ